MTEKRMDKLSWPSDTKLDRSGPFNIIRNLFVRMAEGQKSSVTSGIWRKNGLTTMDAQPFNIGTPKPIVYSGFPGPISIYIPHPHLLLKMAHESQLPKSNYLLSTLRPYANDW